MSGSGSRRPRAWHKGQAVSRSLHHHYSGQAVVLAPMEDITDSVYRQVCRRLGAEVCFTEFVNVESLLCGDQHAVRKLKLTAGDQPTAIQIYGANPDALVQAAVIAEQAGPAFIDINCGCWVPKIAARGAGAGWLRDPDKMIEMAARVVRSVSLPVSVKTRIGWGPEVDMPIVDLARRLEDVGVSALTVHCRTARMRHDGAADWSWARKAREVVAIPVLVNGDVRTADDCQRALRETGCAGVMVGRAAIDHPWVFREARALLDRGERLAPPTDGERLTFLLEVLRENVAFRGEKHGVLCSRRHYAGVLRPMAGGDALKARLYQVTGFEAVQALLEETRHRALSAAAA